MAGATPACCAFALYLFATPAHAEPAARGNLRLSTSATVGWTSGAYRYERDSQPLGDAPIEHLRFGVALSGPALTLSVVPMYALSEAIDLGLSGHASLYPSLSQTGELGESTP